MHDVEIRSEIIARVIARRGRLHLFEKLTPTKTALVVIDMQNTFLRPGAPVEVPKGREIVGNINRLTARLREIGVPVIWVTHANSSADGKSDWPGFFDHFVSAEVRQEGFEFSLHAVFGTGVETALRSSGGRALAFLGVVAPREVRRGHATTTVDHQAPIR